MASMFPENAPLAGIPAAEWVRSLAAGSTGLSSAAWEGLRTLLLGGPGHPIDRLFNPAPNAAPVAAAAPVGPPPLVSAPQPGGPLRFPLAQSGSTAGTTAMSFPTPQLPPPPTLAPPPQMGAPTGVDMSAARRFAEAARPGAPDQGMLDSSKFAGILSGLARGAGSVDPTSPGAFARALAMWGAGGAEGMKEGIDKKFQAGQRHSENMSQYNLNRASQEFQMAKVAADQQNAARMVEFENAKSLYQTNVANQKAMYEFQVQKAGLEAPKVTVGAGGTLMIQQQDPKSGQTNVKVVDINPTMQKLEKMADIVKVSNMPGGEAIKHRLINAEITDPYARDYAYRREAIKEVFNAGAGGAVFGPAYARAAEAAKIELQKENVLPTDMKLYAAQMQERIMSKILPLAVQRNDWIKHAAPHSFTASVLSQAPSAPQVGVP